MNEMLTASDVAMTLKLDAPAHAPPAHLNALPFDILHLLVAHHLDIRATARLGRCSRYLHTACDAHPGGVIHAGGGILLSSHHHWPLLSAVINNDAASFCSALKNLRHAMVGIPYPRPPPLNDAGSWEPHPRLSILVKSCFCVLLTARNDKQPHWWTSMRFLIDTYGLNPNQRADSMRQEFSDAGGTHPDPDYELWASRKFGPLRDTVVEAAVYKAFARRHLDSFESFASVCTETKFIDECLHLGPLVHALFDVGLPCGMRGFQQQLAGLPQVVREKMLFQVMPLAVDDFQDATADHENAAAPDGNPDGQGGASLNSTMYLARLIVGSKNDLGTIIRLVLAFDHCGKLLEQTFVLAALLDACGYHDRPELVDALMRLHLIGAILYPVEHRSVDRNGELVRPKDRFHRPSISFHEGTFEELQEEWVLEMACYGVTRNQLHEFYGVLALCELSVFLVPWLLNALDGPDEGETPHSPWLAIEWLLKHMELNLHLIHLIPFMFRKSHRTYVSQRIYLHGSRARHSDALATILQRVPFDLQCLRHCWGRLEEWHEADMWLEKPGQHVTNNVGCCPRCRQLITAAAATDADRAGSPDGCDEATFSLGRVFSTRGRWRMWYNERPAATLEEESRTICEFLANVDSATDQLDDRDLQLPATWLAFFDQQGGFAWDGPLIYHAWKATALGHSGFSANRVPLAHAMDALIVRECLVEAIQVLADAEEYQASDRQWAVTEVHVESLRVLSKSKPSQVRDLMEVVGRQKRVSTELLSRI